MKEIEELIEDYGQAMTTTDKNKQACEKLGIHWHDWYSPVDERGYHTFVVCRDINCEFSKWNGERYHPENPDFTTKSGRIELWKIIFDAEIGLLYKLLDEYLSKNYVTKISGQANAINFINYYFLDLPDRPNFNDRLLDAVLKFKGEGNE